MTPTIEVEVTGPRGTVPVHALIDTGFDGDLCLPTSIALRLGLSLLNQASVELADGSTKLRLVFEGIVELLGESRPVSIFLTDSDEPLVGTRLLSDCHLSIDFPTERVRVTRKRRRTD